MTLLDTILSGLMRRYQQRVPDVQAILDTMQRDGIIASHNDIENDHIAFRAIGVPHLGIASLEKIFLHCGYTRRDHYDFAHKKLNAYWYSPPEPRYPRTFISELRVHELSSAAQQIIHTYTDELTHDPVNALDLDDGDAVDHFLHAPLWRTPRWDDYTQLRAESEYAAWVIYNRYYLNHFTISVHNLPAHVNTIATFNTFLERNGFLLNDAGGKAKTSADGALIQSSTVAEMIPATFAAGDTHLIAGSYVEFAERRVLADYAALSAESITRQHRRDGFEATNADKIFESTYTTQTQKQEITQ